MSVSLSGEFNIKFKHQIEKSIGEVKLGTQADKTETEKIR